MPTIENDPGYQAFKAATGQGSSGGSIHDFANAAQASMRKPQPQAKERTDYNIQGGSGGPNWGEQGVSPLDLENE